MGAAHTVTQQVGQAERQPFVSRTAPSCFSDRLEASQTLDLCSKPHTVHSSSNTVVCTHTLVWVLCSCAYIVAVTEQ